MIAVALESRTQQLFDDARSDAMAISDPVERLRRIVSSLASGTTAEEAAGVEWLIWTEYWRAALRDDDLRGVAVRGYRGWVSLVSEAIEDCVRAGRIEAPSSVERVATCLVALGDGLGIQVSLGGTGLTWAQAGALVRASLAEMLACPELA